MAFENRPLRSEGGCSKENLKKLNPSRFPNTFVRKRNVHRTFHGVDFKIYFSLFNVSYHKGKEFIYENEFLLMKRVLFLVRVVDVRTMAVRRFADLTNLISVPSAALSSGHF